MLKDNRGWEELRLKNTILLRKRVHTRANPSDDGPATSKSAQLITDSSPWSSDFNLIPPGSSAPVGYGSDDEQEVLYHFKQFGSQCDL